jgi:hypothetical protein
MHLARTPLMLDMGEPARVPLGPLARTTATIAYSPSYTKLAFQAEPLSIMSTVRFA